MASKLPPDVRYVNFRGEPIDLLGTGPRVRDPLPADDPVPAAPLAPADVETVFDALCIAGSPRGKHWLMQLMRGLEWRTQRGKSFGVGEISAALRDLQASGRAEADSGQGFHAPPQALQARLPALLAAKAPAPLWRLWVWADQGGRGAVEAEPMPMSYHPHREMVALVRLVLFSVVDAAL